LPHVGERLAGDERGDPVGEGHAGHLLGVEIFVVHDHVVVAGFGVRVQGLDAVTEVAAEPVVKKYLGVLAAADVYTQSNAYTLRESLRLDSGAPLPIHA
jgi:hypothetical protein